MRTPMRWLLLLAVSFLPAIAYGQQAGELIERYKATDLSQDLMAGHRFYQNPWLYQGKQIYFTGGYQQNISATQAIVAILPSRPPLKYIVVVETDQDLSGAAIVGCVGEVLGTTPISQGFLTRQVPHIQAVECLPQLPGMMEPIRPTITPA